MHRIYLFLGIVFLLPGIVFLLALGTFLADGIPEHPALTVFVGATPFFLGLLGVLAGKCRYRGGWASLGGLVLSLLGTLFLVIALEDFFRHQDPTTSILNATLFLIWGIHQLRVGHAYHRRYRATAASGRKPSLRISLTS